MNHAYGLRPTAFAGLVDTWGNGDCHNYYNCNVPYHSYKSILKNNTFEYYYFNNLNDNINVNLINKNFQDNLFKSHLKLSDNLMDDFKDFWKFKHELLLKIHNSKNTSSNSISTSGISLFTEDFSIRLNDNFLSIKKYRLPWDSLFFSDKFYNIGANPIQLGKITEENLKSPPMYCVFTYTPFESSISTFWMTNLHAYILSRVLNKEFQTISEIANKVQALLSNKQDNSYQKIKSLLLIFFKQISYYEIIETKNHVDSTNATNNNNTITNVANQRCCC